MRIDLLDVTLICIDTICHDLAAMAIRDCLKAAKFGAVHIYTDKKTAFTTELGADTDDQKDELIIFYRAEAHSLSDVLRLLWGEVPNNIQTSHALIVQWDSWILNPAHWSDEYLQYDFIGAPWGWHGDPYEVGNGGFSLRSAKLMRRCQTLPARHPEDDTLCRIFRPHLEKEGFKFAPVELAKRFSFENGGYRPDTFGFHAIFNWPFVLSGRSYDERYKLARNNRYIEASGQLGRLDVMQKYLNETQRTRIMTEEEHELHNRLKAVHGLADIKACM